MKIELNKVTWYSKLIALALFVALPFVGFYYGIQYGKIVANISQMPNAINVSSTQSSGNGLDPYYSDTAEWQTDITNSNFTVASPIDFDTQYDNLRPVSTDWRKNEENIPGILHFSLTVPSDFEPDTNFESATLTIGSSQNPTAVSQCVTADQNAGEVVVTSSILINGAQFAIFHSNSAGAGNFYETASYRTVHNRECYAIEYTIHSSDIGNWPSSYNIQPFNEAKIDALMQNIVGTFKFM